MTFKYTSKVLKRTVSITDLPALPILALLRFRNELKVDLQSIDDAIFEKTVTSALEGVVLSKDWLHKIRKKRKVINEFSAAVIGIIDGQALRITEHGSYCEILENTLIEEVGHAAALKIIARLREQHCYLKT